MSATTERIALPQIVADVSNAARATNDVSASRRTRTGRMSAANRRPSLRAGAGCGICRCCAPREQGRIAIAACSRRV